MKSCWLYLFLLMFIYSCTNDSRKEEGRDLDTIETVKVDLLDSLPWNSSYNEKTQKLQLDHREINMSGVTYMEIISVLNKKYPGIKMDYIGLKKDTLIAKIDDATQLTQNVGTAGAEIYLAEATYSLTEIPPVKAVTIQFVAGDHAMPGTYTRDSFSDFR